MVAGRVQQPKPSPNLYWKTEMKETEAPKEQRLFQPAKQVAWCGRDAGLTEATGVVSLASVEEHVVG